MAVRPDLSPIAGIVDGTCLRGDPRGDHWPRPCGAFAKMERFTQRLSREPSLGIVAGMDHGEWPVAVDVLPDARHLREPDGVVDLIFHPRTPAAQGNNDETHRPGVDGLHIAAAGRFDAQLHVGRPQMRVEVRYQIGGPVEGGDHCLEALGRGSRCSCFDQTSRRRFDVGAEAAEHEHLSAQSEHHLGQSGVVAGCGEPLDRFAHLERISSCAAEHLVHVGEQGGGHQSAASGDGDDAVG